MFCIPHFMSSHRNCITCILSFASNLTSTVSLTLSAYSYGRKQMTQEENAIILSSIVATILLKNLTLSILLNPEIFESKKEKEIINNIYV